MKQTLFLGFLLASMFGAFVYLLISSATTSEKYECYKWQEQSAKFEGFYLVGWQSEQCKAHNIIVNAPVK